MLPDAEVMIRFMDENLGYRTENEALKLSHISEF
jgi:hypothetical protein